MKTAYLPKHEILLCPFFAFHYLHVDIKDNTPYPKNIRSQNILAPLGYERKRQAISVVLWSDFPFFRFRFLKIFRFPRFSQVLNERKILCRYN